MLSPLSSASGNPPPQYLSVVPSDRSLIEKHSPGSLAPGQELKYRNDFFLHQDSYKALVLTSSAATTPTAAEPAIFSTDTLFQTSSGTGSTQRVGRTCTVHLWHVRLRITCHHISNSGTQSDAGSNPQARVVFGVDHQPDPSGGVSYVSDTLFAALPVGTPGGTKHYLRSFAPTAEQKFTILYDKMVELREPTVRSYLTSGIQVRELYGADVDFKTVLNLKCNFPEGASLPSDERLFCFVYLPQAVNAPTPLIANSTNAELHSWVRFTD